MSPSDTAVPAKPRSRRTVTVAADAELDSRDMPSAGSAVNTADAGASSAAAGSVQLAYERICSTIMDHTLPPGTRLIEHRLCEIFGLGRTRVRQVLQRLANERLVTLLPNRGAEVSKPSPQDALDIFDFLPLAEKNVQSQHWAYLMGGSDDDATVRANEAAFSQWQIRARRQVEVDLKQQREQARNTLREQKFDEAYAEWVRDLRGRAYIEMREPPL